MSGGNNSLLVGFPWGGGNQQTLAGNGEGEVYEASGIKQNADGSITLAAQPNSNTSAAWPNNLPYTSGGVLDRLCEQRHATGRRVQRALWLFPDDR